MNLAEWRTRIRELGTDTADVAAGFSFLEDAIEDGTPGIIAERASSALVRGHRMVVEALDELKKAEIAMTGGYSRFQRR